MRMTRFRWIVITLIFGITVINYIDRSAISYAIGDIVRDLRFSAHDRDIYSGFILSAFSIGYMLTTFFGGIFADRYGARLTLFWAALLWSIASGLTGLAVGFVMLACMRILLGVAEGPNFPAMNRGIADWLSSRERAIALSNSLVAVPLALAIGAPVATELIIHLGWRGMFIVLMILGLAWLPLWQLLFRDFPEHSRHVNDAELRHIRDGRPVDRSIQSKTLHLQRRKLRGLWKFLLTNPTLLANDWSFFVFGYFLFFFMTWLPTYLQTAYHLNLRQVGWFGTLPWLVAALLLWLFGYVSDALLRKTGSLRIARSHPIWISQLLAGLCILPVTFIHDLAVTLVCLSLAVGLSMSANAAFYAVNVDVARERAGTALGIMDTFFAISGFVAPLVTGWVVGVTRSFNAAFWLLALLALSSVVVVLLFHHPDRSGRLGATGPGDDVVTAAANSQVAP
ncbi:MAG: MFS transporter [Gammaproteobacteria bacterium]|nr:MFS transporter [Gammaproteobacteria bacterium]MDE2346654.1 MFS transporter [Gammaproteobacteria bacterium]